MMPSYTDFVFNSYECKYIKIGNIYLDASILVEGESDEK